MLFFCRILSKVLDQHAVPGAVLSPIVRFCLKRGLRVRDLDDVVQRTLVEEARVAIEQARGEVSVSKISVIAARHRLEFSLDVG